LNSGKIMALLVPMMVLMVSMFDRYFLPSCMFATVFT